MKLKDLFDNNMKIKKEYHSICLEDYAGFIIDADLLPEPIEDIDENAKFTSFVDYFDDSNEILFKLNFCDAKIYFINYTNHPEIAYYELKHRRREFRELMALYNILPEEMKLRLELEEK